MIAKRLCVALALFALCANAAHGQVKDAGKFSRLRVSEELRARLAERLNLFVEYERTGQFEKQYDLLPSETRLETRRDEYAEGKRKAEGEMGRLLELKVKGVDRKLTDNKWVGITIRVTLGMKDGTKYSDQPVSMIAYLRDGDWYLSLNYIEV